MQCKIFHKISRFKNKALGLWRYCADGVWNDTRHLLRINIVKTANLSIRSFFNADIQSRACALTYRTTLALVPAIALFFAIGRGFGLQDSIRQELINTVDSKTPIAQTILNYVDSYLDQSASQGLFVGIGIVLLLWTLISLLSAVENTFNDIWGVKQGRSIWRKATDYLAIFLMLPILMICASGVSVFVTTTAESLFPNTWITASLSWLLDGASLVMLWLFFTGVYMLIPNTKVKFKNAAVAGTMAAIAFLIVQWLFVTGQVYVSKYNAIYGSVAFVPLLLIWMQLTWVITLSGAIICYASQNIFRFNFSKEISSISLSYRTRILVAVASIVTRIYEREEPLISDEELALRYGLPSSLVSKTVNFLIDANVLMRVEVDPKEDKGGLAPAIDPARLTVGELMRRVRHTGASEFIPGFNVRFARINETVMNVESAIYSSGADTLIRDLEVEPLIEQP